MVHTFIHVLGIKPYERYEEMATKTLAKEILRSLKAYLDRQLEKVYTRNLTLLVRREKCLRNILTLTSLGPFNLNSQRKFIREDSASARLEGKLYTLFKEWLQTNYGGEPTPEEWLEIMENENDEPKSRKIQIEHNVNMGSNLIIHE